MERLLALGALEAFLTPVQMKKNRPGILLTVLTTFDVLPRVQDFIFCETTSFGMRMSERTRVVLDREFHWVQTPFGEVSIKLGVRDGQIVQRSPEFDSCRRLAEASGASIREVFAAALLAADPIQFHAPI